MGIVTADVAISADGFVAGLNQTAERPFGDGPTERLHAWMFETPEENPAELAAILDAGAFIMGRHMFGPSRGDWDLEWKGWWGPTPPYAAPVFVLTHHEREAVEMDGVTTFHFVTDGIESALDQAKAAAGERNVAIAGGASTINQYLAAGLIDELRVHIAPVLLGAGERLFDGVAARELRQVSARAASLTTHITYKLS